MQDVGAVLQAGLEQLVADLEGASLLGGHHSQHQGVHHHIMPEGFQHVVDEPKERLVLPTLMANMSQRPVRLEFMPAADTQAWWASVFCAVHEQTLCFKITRRDALLWFSRSQNSAAWDEFRVDMADYDDKYFFFGTNIELTKQILKVDKRLEQLCSIPHLEHIAFDERFARLTYLVRPEDDLSVASMRKNLENWVELVQEMESWTAVDSGASH